MKTALAPATAAVALALTALAGAAGAQKLEVKSEADPQADFKAIRTYAWLPPAPMIGNVAPGVPTNPNLSQEVLGPYIIAAVDRQLAARGLVKVDKDQADVHVAYFAALTTGMSSTHLGEYYGYVTGWGPPVPLGYSPTTSVTVYEKGTIVIDIVQRAANRGVWHGSVATRIEQERKLENRVKRINEAMERVFQRFPIKRRS